MSFFFSLNSLLLKFVGNASNEAVPGGACVDARAKISGSATANAVKNHSGYSLVDEVKRPVSIKSDPSVSLNSNCQNKNQEIYFFEISVIILL